MLGRMAEPPDITGVVSLFASPDAAWLTGQYVDAATLTARVKAAFAQDKWVKGRDISVRTDHGVVDLTGGPATASLVRTLLGEVPRVTAQLGSVTRNANERTASRGTRPRQARWRSWTG